MSSTRPPSATIADVAREAGVSRTTVSHVLSGNRPVSAEVSARVLAIVDHLGYRPSPLAVSLRTRRTKSVALLIADITNPFYPMLARGLQDVLADDGYHLFVSNTDAKAENERGYIDDYIARQVDGIVISPWHITDAEISPAIEAGIAIVEVGTRLRTSAVDRVIPNNQTGAADATRHLLGRQPAALAYIGGVGEANGPRERGFDEALREAGHDPAHAPKAYGDWTRAGGANAMADLLTTVAPARLALLCANDLTAIGALDLCRSRNLRVPEDVAIVGYDDIEAANLVSPPLTTVSNPAYEIGAAAGTLLSTRLSNDPTPVTPRQITIDCALVVRESA